MAKNDNLKDFLTDVADAIREKKGTTDAINPQDFSAEIASIETGGGSTMEYWKKGDGTHAISGVMTMYCPIVKVTVDDDTKIAPGAVWVANPTSAILAVAFDRTYKFLMDGDIITLGEILPDLGWDDSFFVQITEEEFYSIN